MIATSTSFDINDNVESVALKNTGKFKYLYLMSLLCLFYTAIK